MRATNRRSSLLPLLTAPLLALAAACGDDEVASASATASGTTDATGEPATTTTTSSTSAASTADPSESGSGTADATTTTTTTTTTGPVTSTTSETTGDPTTTTTTTTTTTGGGPICGDGVVDAGEACDLGADNGAAGTCCSDACELLAAVVCRPGSGDMCDPDELCDGEGPLCPDDAVSAAGTACGEAPGDACLAPPTCSGAPGEACGEPEVDEGLVCAVQSGCSPALTCGDVDGQCTCALPPLEGPLTALIINSQAQNPGHDMDTAWKALLDGLGHDATIVPQSTLDTQGFIAAADVLIVASGVNSYTATQVANIQAFVEAGKGVYLQSEYLSSFGGNQAFAGVVNALGGTFSWTGEVSGQLNPVAVSGCLAGHDGCVGALTYFWYAQAGGAVAPGFEAFLHKNGKDIGFSYCPPDPALGVIVTTTDQDFIRVANLTPSAQDLMENMFNRIARPQACKP